MLSVLRIQNLAIVDEVEVELGAGLNVLTGETGAGKSIVLKAIDLLLGRRGTAEVVRAGADRCTVEGLFNIKLNTLRTSLPNIEELEELLINSEGGEGEDTELLIRRTIDSAGRSKAYVNGKLVALGTLSALGTSLVDITGQHAQHLLFDPEQHRDFLDTFGVPEELIDQVAKSYLEFKQARKALENFLQDNRTRAELIAKLSAEREELGEANITKGERQNIETELSRLANVEKLGSCVQRALELIESDEGGIDTQLSALTTLVTDARKLDPAVANILSLIDQAQVQLGEARLELDSYGAELNADPDRLEELRERLALIARLERKYTKPCDSLVEHLEKVMAELAVLEDDSIDEPALRLHLEKATEKLKIEEQALTTKRKSVAKALSAAVEKELRPLNMERAKFHIEILPIDSSVNGVDKVEFQLAANPGEPPRALAKVASGGELSRVLLVLKTLLNDERGPGTQVFDEVDSGIGGAVAQVVGEKLFAVSRSSQVLLITHAPQIAAFADHHFVVAKETQGDRTTSSIRPISEEESVIHIARMLAGKNLSTPFEASARELMQEKKKHLLKLTPEKQKAKTVKKSGPFEKGKNFKSTLAMN